MTKLAIHAFFHSCGLSLKKFLARPASGLTFRNILSYVAAEVGGSSLTAFTPYKPFIWQKTEQSSLQADMAPLRMSAARP
jgi:hypothetical protein